MLGATPRAYVLQPSKTTVAGASSSFVAVKTLGGTTLWRALSLSLCKLRT